MRNDPSAAAISPPRWDWRPAAGDRRTSLLVFIIIVGLALRLYRLGVPSIWYDEGVSLFLAGQPLPAMLAHTAGDIHPPLYYALLHVWTRLAGNSEFAAGFFSLFCGILLIPLVYQLGRRIAGRDVGVLAALLVAFSPYHIWYAQELRMYTLGAGLGLTAALGLWEAIKGERPARRGWVLYSLSAAAGLYTLYYFAFLLLALNGWAIYALLRKPQEPAGRRRLLLGWGLAQAGALALYAPWLPIFFRQATQPPVPPWREFTPLGRLLTESWTALSFGHSVEATQVWPLLLITLALAGVGLLRLLRQDASAALLTAGYFLIPLALIFLFSSIAPLYHVRYLFTYAPAFSILLAAGLEAIGERRRALGSLALLAWLAGCALSLWQYHFALRYAGDDHRAAVQYLNAQWRPGDAILLNAGYIYPPFLYYNQLPVAWRGRLSAYGVAFTRAQQPAGLALIQTGSVDGPATLGWGSSASDFYALSRPATAAALERIFQDYERVWVYRCYDTVTDPAGFIRAWLDEHGVQFEETPAFAGLSHLRVQGYLPKRAASVPPAQPPAPVRFGDGLELLAYAGPTGEVVGGAPLDLTLWFAPTHPALPRLAVTLRLVDDAGRPWVQQDLQPLGNRYPSEDWPAGQPVRLPARLHVPLGLPPGQYQAVLGVYEAGSQRPWETPGGEQLLALATLRAEGQIIERPAQKPLAVFDRRIELLDAKISASHVQAGLSVFVDLTWRASAAPQTDLVVFLQALDAAGRPVALQESQTVAGRFPVERWAAGQVVAERRELAVPADTPAGACTLIVGLYRPPDSKARLQVDSFWPWGRKDYYPIGSVTVDTRIPQLQPPRQLPHPVGKRPSEGIELVSYELDASSAGAAPRRLGVTLLWRRVGPVGGNYLVVCRLVGEGGGVRGESVGIPAGGQRPTVMWMAGEYVLDARDIPIAADAPAGRYRVVVSLYDAATNAPVGEALILGEVILP